MVKADIVDEVQNKTGFPRQKVQESVDLVVECVKEALQKNEKVEFRGFGIFRVKERKKGVGRNLKTGETVPIKAVKTIKFKPSSRFFV